MEEYDDVEYKSYDEVVDYHTQIYKRKYSKEYFEVKRLETEIKNLKEMIKFLNSVSGLSLTIEMFLLMSESDKKELYRDHKINKILNEGS